MAREIFSASVLGLTSDGRGIVTHPSGLKVFVPGVWPGEEGTFELVERKSKIGVAEIREIVLSSPHRTKPPCVYHGHHDGFCGGCAWQFISYEEQLSAKQQRVEQELSRIGIKHRILPILPSLRQLGYRNRAQFKSDGQQIGFLSPRSETLTPISDCLVLTEKNRETLRGLCQQLPNEHWVPRARSGRKLDAASDPNSNKTQKKERRRKLPGRQHRQIQLTTLDIDESVSAQQVSVNRRLGFMQANSQQNTVMREWLTAKLGKLDQGDSVLELFSGAGNLTEVIAKFAFQSITAVDGAGEAIESLGQKSLDGVKAFAVDLYDDYQFKRLIVQNPAEVLILDPPRDGLRAKSGLFDKKSKMRDVFYISCNLATLVRDLQLFLEMGFKIREVQPLDMFPQTPHIELMVHLRRRNL